MANIMVQMKNPKNQHLSWIIQKSPLHFLTFHFYTFSILKLEKLQEQETVKVNIPKTLAHLHLPWITHKRVSWNISLYPDMLSKT